MAGSSFAEVLFTAAQGEISWINMASSRVGNADIVRLFTDVILWVSLRATLHDAVFVDIFDTRPHSKTTGLRGSRVEQL